MSKFIKKINKTYVINNYYFYRFKLAINDCTTSLKLDSSYVKTYQRRSAAYMALELYDEAKKDLNYVLKLEPNNMKAKIDIETIDNKIKQVSVKN